MRPILRTLRHAAAAGLLVPALLIADEPVPTATAAVDDSPYVAAPVHYADQMLVFVTADGVAAVAFGETVKDESGVDKSYHGVNYRWRYLPAGETEEHVGEGQVFERRIPEGGLGPHTFLEAGDVRIEWSRGGEGRGWIYYRPEETAVLIAKTELFEDSEVPFADGSSKVPKLDLRRYRNLAPRPDDAGRPPVSGTAASPGRSSR